MTQERQLTDTGLSSCSEHDFVAALAFQTLGFTRIGAQLVRAKRMVERTWCWPCFAEWTLVLRSLSRQGLAPQRRLSPASRRKGATVPDPLSNALAWCFGSCPVGPSIRRLEGATPSPVASEAGVGRLGQPSQLPRLLFPASQATPAQPGPLHDVQSAARVIPAVSTSAVAEPVRAGAARICCREGPGADPRKAPR